MVAKKPDALSDVNRIPVEVLADEFVECHRNGESPTIEQYTERYPDLADEIREIFPLVAAMEDLKWQKQQGSDRRATLGGETIDRLGDYRIVREIGRGGMGIVYEAEQESLGRRVAIKVLPNDPLKHEKNLERFQREARTAAKLHHTNIVPVFGVGQKDGYHYFVMQYIRGCGLDRVLDALIESGHADLDALAKMLADSGGEFSQDVASRHGTTARQRANDTRSGNGLAPAASPVDLPANSKKTMPHEQAFWHQIAGLGIQAANALDYAHRHGTIHRDIKPANLILDAYGVLWIADFGLARPSQTHHQNHTDDLVGTLRYMAPECFDSKPTEASDIYGLGLTLYELVTRTIAFDGESDARVVARVQAGHLPAPRSLRPDLPRDLETIILKAIQVEPSRRYASAAALEDDLQRFLDGRPIAARRMSPAERLVRWSRRNTAVASLTAFAACLLVLVAVVASVGYVRTTQALAAANAERRKAEATSNLASNALDRIIDRYTADDASRDEFAAESVGSSLPSGSEISADTAAMLEDLLHYYDRLAEQDADDPRMLVKAALARRRVADIHHRLGDRANAVIAYNDALEKFERFGGDDDHVRSDIDWIRERLNLLGPPPRMPPRDRHPPPHGDFNSGKLHHPPFHFDDHPRRPDLERPGRRPKPSGPPPKQ